MATVAISAFLRTYLKRITRSGRPLALAMMTKSLCITSRMSALSNLVIRAMPINAWQNAGSAMCFKAMRKPTKSAASRLSTSSMPVTCGGKGVRGSKRPLIGSRWRVMARTS